MIVFPSADAVRSVDPPTPFTRFILEGVEAHPAIVRAAHEAGVRILAGTDSPAHHGNVAAEALRLSDAGIGGDAAVGGRRGRPTSFWAYPGSKRALQQTSSPTTRILDGLSARSRIRLVSC